MTIVIDPQFSVYGLVQRNYNQKQIIRHRKTMSQISFEIEDAARDIGGKTRMFAGFQHLSKFLPQVNRYRKLAANVESIYVFGIPDAEVPEIEKVKYVHLSPSDQLSKEWFVICYGKNYSSALATEEISRFTDPDESRVFNGIWSFNPFIVSVIGDWISSLVDANPIRHEVSDISHQQHVRNMIQSISLLIERIDKMDSVTLSERLIILRHELQTTLQSELQVSLDKAL